MCEKQRSDGGGTRWACSFLIKLIIVCFFMLFAIDYRELKQRVTALEQNQNTLTLPLVQALLNSPYFQETTK